MGDESVIAIDGPAGSGKSTVAQAVARELGVAYLDTGAMYRSVTHAALERGVAGSDGDALAPLACELDLDVGERVVVDGADVTRAIRGAAVNESVSVVAAHPSVRAELVGRQRRWATSHDGGVVEGRDIGTVVFPNAHLKVFLTAGEGERARRRSGEVDIAQRDRLDSTRSVSPLKVADDAVVIDTTELAIDEVVAQIMEHV